MPLLLKQLRDNWIVLIFVGTTVMQWATYSSRLAQAEQSIVELKQVAAEINQINIRLAVIQEKVTNIEDNLDINTRGKK